MTYVKVSRESDFRKKPFRCVIGLRSYDYIIYQSERRTAHSQLLTKQVVDVESSFEKTRYDQTERTAAR